jgi:anti-sigma regulatory factor (Ser/Thr protein kinase)
VSPALEPELAGRLELVISELSTNAVVHARSPFEVRLWVASKIRVEVSDASSAPPTVRRSGRTGQGGRGLLIVAVTADRWGFEPTADGKVVWAELSARPGPTVLRLPSASAPRRTFR